MAKTKVRRTTSISRARSRSRKKRSHFGRQGRPVAEPQAPAVIANSVFALTAKPKSWADLADKTAEERDPLEPILYKDLVKAYNHGAELVGVEKVTYDNKKVSATAVSDLLELFKKNILPEGFDVNIDEHFNKRANREGYHFTMFRGIQFPRYWHFFDIKPVVTQVLKHNKKLHDLFIVFLRSFIGYCSIPTWFEGPMVGAQFRLASYLEELREVIKKGVDDQQLERVGMSAKEVNDRLTGIEKTMKIYGPGGDADRYMKMIVKAKPMKPGLLLRTLKKFPSQHHLVKFMKQACELMKGPVALSDFCYHQGDGPEDGLQFHEQVVILWDWSDHYSATQATGINSMAQGSGTFNPTLCARIAPFGLGGLKLESLKDGMEWPKKLTVLQSMFQRITERYVDYKKSRELI